MARDHSTRPDVVHRLARRAIDGPSIRTSSTTLHQLDRTPCEVPPPTDRPRPVRDAARRGGEPGERATACPDRRRFPDPGSPVRKRARHHRTPAASLRPHPRSRSARLHARALREAPPPWSRAGVSPGRTQAPSRPHVGHRALRAHRSFPRRCRPISGARREGRDGGRARHRLSASNELLRAPRRQRPPPMLRRGRRSRSSFPAWPGSFPGCAGSTTGRKSRDAGRTAASGTGAEPGFAARARIPRKARDAVIGTLRGYERHGAAPSR